jgi:hypothetical protein
MATSPLSVCVDGSMEAGRALRDSILVGFPRFIDQIIQRMVYLRMLSRKVFVSRNIRWDRRTVRKPPDCCQYAQRREEDVDLLAMDAS